MRWTLSLNVRSDIAKKTHEIFGVHRYYVITKELTPARTKRNNADEEMVLSTLKRFNVFAGSNPHVLQSICSKGKKIDKNAVVKADERFYYA